MSQKQTNLYLVDRIDCEDGQDKNTSLEQLVDTAIVHPPEIVQRWDMWKEMHITAKKSGLQNITAQESLKLLQIFCVTKISFSNYVTYFL